MRSLRISARTPNSAPAPTPAGRKAPVRHSSNASSRNARTSAGARKPGCTDRPLSASSSTIRSRSITDPDGSRGTGYRLIQQGRRKGGEGGARLAGSALLGLGDGIEIRLGLEAGGERAAGVLGEEAA